MRSCLSVLGNNPIDVVKTRMQGIEATRYKNTLDCFVTTLKVDGPLGFYKVLLFCHHSLRGHYLFLTLHDVLCAICE